MTLPWLEEYHCQGRQVKSVKSLRPPRPESAVQDLNLPLQLAIEEQATPITGRSTRMLTFDDGSWLIRIAMLIVAEGCQLVGQS